MTSSDLIAPREREAVLAQYGIRDGLPDPGFDDIVQLVGHVCEAPIALVTLAAGDRLWFKARMGVEAADADLESSICAHAFDAPDLLIVPDLASDPRTRSNPMVAGDPHIRFYAGAPLRTSDGVALGSLCVIDDKPRPGGLTDRQATALRAFARQVMTQLELRRSIGARQAADSERRRVATALTRSEDKARADTSRWRGLFERMSEGFVVGEVIRDDAGTIRDWLYVEVNPAWSELVGLDASAVVGRTVRELFPGIEDEWVQEFAQVVETGEPVAFTRQVGSSRRWYEGRAFALDGERFGVFFVEVTERLTAERRRDALLEIGDRLRDADSIPDIIGDAAQIVGRALGVSRAGFGLLDASGDYVDITDWTADGVASIAGHHRFADYGDIACGLRRGETLVITDVRTDPRTAADPRPMLDIGIGALVNVPVQEHGRTVAVLIAQSTEPRDWSQETLDFLRNVADRITVSVARVRAEAEQAILNQELSHRMKNTMAIIQAVAVQTLKTVPDRAPVDALLNRLHSLSAAHDVLLKQNWAAAQLAAVAAAVLGSIGLAERVDRAGPDLLLGPRATLSLSLLLHELTTNALKHGALSAEGGRVALAWRLETVADAPELVLTWHERGGPPPREPGRKGFGSRLIHMGLVGTGGVRLDFPASGLMAEFRAPLEQVQHS